MYALVVNTKNEIRRVEYDPPHYDVLREAVGGGMSMSIRLG
jgi:hypothetical protein